MFVLQDPPKGN